MARDTVQRQSDILALARECGRISVETIARRFRVTVQTARRDLAALCARGHLARVHGGAVPSIGSSHIGYGARRALNAAAKARIGRACAAQVPDGTSVFVDVGTTCEAVAEALGGRRGLMVVTNNLNAATVLARNAQAEVILAGGVLRRADGALLGEMTLDFLRPFKLDVAIIGASAIDPEGDLLDFDPGRIRVSQALIEKARQRILVSDSSKFARAAPLRIGSLAEIETFVTDAPPPAPLHDRCRDWDTRVILA